MKLNVQKIYIKFLHTHKICTNCTKFVQSANWKELETWNVCFFYLQIMYKLYKTYTKANCFWTYSIKKASFQTFYDILYMYYNIIQNWIVGIILNPEIYIFFKLKYHTWIIL